jgi:hypothetical protein
MGQQLTWADYARSILKQAHEIFTDYGSRYGTGPWYIVNGSAGLLFIMKPCVDEGYYSFSIRPSHDFEYWIFEVIA